MRPKYLFALCRKAVTAWIDDFAPSMGAAISYYTMFSLAPLLVIVIAVAGALFGREAVEGQIAVQLTGLIGAEGAIAVQGLVRSASEPGRGLIAGSISIAVLIVGATTVFAELQSALDRIWHVPEKDKPTGVWALLRARVLSFGLIFGLAFLLMVTLIVSAAVAAFGSWAGGLLPGSQFILIALNIAISVSISTVLFAMIFKFMPTARIAWRDVWVGAAVTAVLFEVGKTLIGLYLGKSGVTESFAAAGSLVVLLAWVYYAAQIFLLGAEFTKVYANEHGSVAGQKALAATKVAAAHAAAGTDRIADARPEVAVAQPGASQPAVAQPAVAALAARTSDTQSEVDRRTRVATAALIRQLVLLSVVTLTNVVATRWTRRQQRRTRSAKPRLRSR